MVFGIGLFLGTMETDDDSYNDDYYYNNVISTDSNHGSHNISFHGSAHCNIRSHSCSGFVPMKNDSKNCAVCYSNSKEKCHIITHQRK